MDNEIKKEDALLQQEFPTVEGDKTIVERQKNQVLESHETYNSGKMLGDEDSPSTLVG